ncbi:uncharacterized protein LOC111441700 [Cucurbita moschata]|uniref:Uncharacterized protein LOC111441700 n=1 Tax=Cucurbita moschata TaxID=3662 RepID=A0A6J1F2Y2_CUCMO|nr:uncharacterized protein LOC111441700 [Cucurbita moschata]
MWLRSIESVFVLTNCPEAHRVECAMFMLHDDAELWWQATRDLISPEGGVVSWVEFKDVFSKQYYPEDVQLRKQQKEFSKLKRFAPELVNTDYKTARQFVLGLDTKIRNTVKAISPTTYAAALRAAKAMEGPDSSREPPSSLVRQKRRRDQTDRNELSFPQTQRRSDRQRLDYRREQQGSENRSESRPKCKDCDKNHWGQCLVRSGACFRCGKAGHLAKDCFGSRTTDVGNQQKSFRIANNPH